MKGINRLTHAKVQSWVANPDAGRKLSDGGGLTLVRLPAGGATWQSRYRFGGVERTFSIGPVGIAEARAAQVDVKRALRDGKDPMVERQLARAALVSAAGDTFEDVSRAWLAMRRGEWSAKHYAHSKLMLENHAHPALGSLPVRNVTPALVSKIVDDVQKASKRETAAKLLRHVRGIFRYAAAKGLRDDNPADNVVEILGKPQAAKHRPAILTKDGVCQVLVDLRAAPISLGVRVCHTLIAYTVVRISNAVAARWEDFDLDAGRWVIPRASMKMKDRTHDHLVLLAPALVEDLKAWHAVQGKPAAGFLFPGSQGRQHVSREAVEQVLLSIGYRDRHTCHGWRSSFSTLAKDEDFDLQAVDLTLDHVHDNAVARAYDRGERLTKRVELMAWWAGVLQPSER